MNKPVAPATEPAAEHEKKKNLGAKIGVAFVFGSVIGGKLSIPGLVMDLNNMFPKGMPVGAKFKTTFSKEVVPLVQEAITQEMVKGRGPLIAMLVATKWSMILPTVGGLALGIIGWQRADRIRNSEDIIKHPIKSTKIILGLQKPDPEPTKAAEDKAADATTSYRDRVTAARSEEQAIAR